MLSTGWHVCTCITVCTCIDAIGGKCFIQLKFLRGNFFFPTGESAASTNTKNDPILPPNITSLPQTAPPFCGFGTAIIAGGKSSLLPGSVLLTPPPGRRKRSAFRVEASRTARAAASAGVCRRPTCPGQPLFRDAQRRGGSGGYPPADGRRCRCDNVASMVIIDRRERARRSN